MAVYDIGKNYCNKSIIVAKKLDTFSQEAKILCF